MTTQPFDRLRVNARSGRRNHAAFTLVELLVVIAIIGMLAALLMPAINSARESARQAQCMNNQRNLAQAALQYATTKEYFPGYRDLLPSQNIPNKYYVISWQVALMPSMGKTDTYQALQNDSIGQIAGGTPMPYWDASICPSDNSGTGKTSPWTSYVANTGYLDYGGSLPADLKANGVFQDRARYTTANPKSKVSLTDIKDGQATTLMISENLDANYYVDQPVIAFTAKGNPPTPKPADTAARTTAANGNCAERGAGFVWWDTTPSLVTGNPPPVPGSAPPSSPTGGPNNKNPAGINVDKGNWDGSWPTDFFDTSKVDNYAARPSSNHPGGVIVAFVGGNTRFLREDIDYPVYCLLMTSDGANACNQLSLHTVTNPTTNSNDGATPPHSWQKYKVLDEGSL